MAPMGLYLSFVLFGLGMRVCLNYGKVETVGDCCLVVRNW